MTSPARILVDPKILTGKPVVRGTRISVEMVVGLLATGWSHEQILASYPHLSEEDIRACLAYASELLRKGKVYSLKPHEIPGGREFSASGTGGTAQGRLGSVLGRRGLRRHLG